jgi:N-acetylmuramoyl-L-alanine amidase
VHDIQARLTALGFDTAGDPEARFGPATRVAVEGFQHRRGLRVDGVCGRQTWATLVEAGFGLGDRYLYLRTPMLRGDDVAELQQRLGALGFDTGRVDGIFGQLTASALIEFQRNAGQPADGIVGPTTVEELRRVQTRQREPESVSTVRAREDLRRAPPTLARRRLALGEAGGLSTTVAALRRRLTGAGAMVTELHHPDGSLQAAEANAAGVDVYVGLRLDPEQRGCATAFYAGYRTESPGGRRLAELVQARVPASLGIPDRGVQGMSVPLLRETVMPAVIVEVGGPSVVVEQGPVLARALVEALTDWAAATWD